MERNQVHTLLQKYYDGMTSKEEDRELLNFFRTGEVPEEFDIDKMHLLALEDMQNEDIEVPDNLKLK